ncbi:hypothetical protein [Cellulomonas endophytica]|uniref:hypothetical protein n=1 Tax=Cellulomonas endophytica TaxID=2494735 RepID=UPI00196B43FA|nr:hypothetical protein [Cellulomonas endophytica]
MSSESGTFGHADLGATSTSASDDVVVSRWDRGGLGDAGFHGFVRFSELPAADVPAEEGVYVVVRPSVEPPSFRAVSPAVWFKGQDPTVPVDMLRAAWTDSAVLYIGKAGRVRRVGVA